MLERSAAQLRPHAACLLSFHEHEALKHEEVRALMMHALGNADWLPRDQADAVLRQHLTDGSPLVRAAADRGLQRDKGSNLDRAFRNQQLQSVKIRPH